MTAHRFDFFFVEMLHTFMLTLCSNCEVCVNVINSIDQTLTMDDKKQVQNIEDKMRTWCDTAKGKEKKMCYYMGVGDEMEGSAGGFKRDISSSIMRGINGQRLCNRLKKKDGQICELHYDIEINKDTDLSKLRVKQLREICNNNEIDTSGMIEKNDFINAIRRHFGN